MGHHFAGSWRDSFGNPVTDFTGIIGDATFYAHYVLDTFTITFTNLNPNDDPGGPDNTLTFVRMNGQTFEICDDTVLIDRPDDLVFLGFERDGAIFQYYASFIVTGDMTFRALYSVPNGTHEIVYWATSTAAPAPPTDPPRSDMLGRSQTFLDGTDTTALLRTSESPPGKYPLWSLWDGSSWTNTTFTPGAMATFTDLPASPPFIHLMAIVEDIDYKVSFPYVTDPSVQDFLDDYEHDFDWEGVEDFLQGLICECDCICGLINCQECSCIAGIDFCGLGANIGALHDLFGWDVELIGLDAGDNVIRREEYNLKDELGLDGFILALSGFQMPVVEVKLTPRLINYATVYYDWNADEYRGMHEDNRNYGTLSWPDGRNGIRHLPGATPRVLGMPFAVTPPVNSDGDPLEFDGWSTEDGTDFFKGSDELPALDPGEVIWLFAIWVDPQ
jgi:hypothetical protein